MDQSQNRQLQQPATFSTQLQQQQQESSPNSSQQIDSTPQDVLAEARKNLQVLIDSGLSKDLLHKWVDDSQSLQFSFTTLSQSLASQAQTQSSSLAPQHPPPPPPPPQCPPPPPPSHLPSTPAATPPMASMAGPVPSTAAKAAPPASIKCEALPDDVSTAWSSTTTLTSNAPSERTQPSNSFSDADAAAIFLPPSAPFSHHSHRPRISISSVSSGSSGHASIWSTNSAQSSFSWHSGTTGGRSMAPLPMPPPSAGVPVLGGSHVAAAAAANPNRQNIYWCTSCETSFKRKYDWKRHEDEFHERWRKYPCPEPGCNRSFWGSNSFNQHHKQCHGCKTCPHAEKVVKFLRKRKYWACGFCSALHPARERHVEHVARHFESGLTKSDWMHSRVIYGLLHQPLIHEAWDSLVSSKQADYGGRRPQFSWHPSRTGRAQGFLEKENNGQLQDLLEFFSGDEGEARWIVKSAYELADIVTLNPTPSPQFGAAATAASMAPRQHFGQQEAHVPFQPLASQPPMLPSSSPNSQSPYTSPFRSTMFVPSQQFPSASRPSPESSHSPMAASQSPMAASHSPLEQRELPQLPSSAPATAGETVMDFEYSPAPVVFEDWESLAGAVVSTDVTPQPQGNAQGDWNMMQYFADPRVTS